MSVRTPLGWRDFLGWRIALLATITAALTGPGQTIGVSVFVDPMIETLGLTRSELSTAYLVGTLLGAMALVPVGRGIDRFGARRAMTLIGIAFGLGLLVMSGVQGFITLVVGFTLIRWLGQGSLQLVSTLAITPWFARRRGFVFGLVTTATAVLMSFTPIVLGAAIGLFDWRLAWIIAALAVWLVVVPIARFGIIDRPSDVDQYPDGDPAPLPSDEPRREAVSRTRREALRQPRFWLLAVVIGTTSMLVTALNFHQISLLGDQGLTVTEAAAMFLPQVLGALTAGLIVGALADRFPARFLLMASMALLALSLLLAARLTPGPIDPRLRRHARRGRRCRPPAGRDAAASLVWARPHRVHPGRRCPRRGRGLVDGAGDPVAPQRGTRWLRPGGPGIGGHTGRHRSRRPHDLRARVRTGGGLTPRLDKS